MTEEKKDFGSAEKEIDEPIVRITESERKDFNELVKEDHLNDERKRKNKRFFVSVYVFLICLGALICVWIIDSILKAKGLETSEFTSVIIEILKALLFTICGFAFATHWNKE